MEEINNKSVTWLLSVCQPYSKRLQALSIISQNIFWILYSVLSAIGELESNKRMKCICQTIRLMKGKKSQTEQLILQEEEKHRFKVHDNDVLGKIRQRWCIFK